MNWWMLELCLQDSKYYYSSLEFSLELSNWHVLLGLCHSPLNFSLDEQCLEASASQERILFAQTYHTYATNTPPWKALGNLHHYHWGTDSGNADARSTAVRVKMQPVSHKHRPQASAGKKNNLVSIFFLLFTWSFQEPSLNKLFTIAEIL